MADITDFSVGQGETFAINTRIVNQTQQQNLDLTNYTVSGQVRENHQTNEVAATFDVTKIAPETSGSLYIELSSTETANLELREYVYDIIISDNSNPPIVRRILEGRFNVKPSVTR